MLEGLFGSDSCVGVVSWRFWSCRWMVEDVIGWEAEAGEERSCSQSAEQCRWRALSSTAGSGFKKEKEKDVTPKVLFLFLFFKHFLFINLSSYRHLRARCNLLASPSSIFMYLKRAGSECAETRRRAVLANGTYCCAFVLTMLSPSEFGSSPSLSVVDPWILGFICE